MFAEPITETAEEMPVTTRACHGVALILLLLSLVHLVSRACLLVGEPGHAVPFSLDLFTPTLYMAAVTALLVWLGFAVERRCRK